MVNKKRNDFTPVIAIPPGETLKENIEYVNMSQTELAERTGLSIKHINEIVKGKSPITQDTALKLEYVLGIPASFWNNLEANYRETSARLKDEEDLKSEFEIVKEIPYAKMAQFGWVAPSKDKKIKVKNLRNYFGVASLKNLPLVFEGAFRKADGENVSPYALAAWLRRGELLANSIETNSFDKMKLKKMIPIFRKLTLEGPEEFYPKMVELCSSCGIALVLVPHLPKTYACGATQWISSDKAVVQLSVRGAKADIFWFTFFHEIAHIILHTKKEFHLQESESNECIEDEADTQARDWLIPPEQYKKFIMSHAYTTCTGITTFAKELEIHPCIVVGRLLHDKKISYCDFDNLRPSFKIVI
jgi:HTH-type transcriptional regulator/antitoxin HigA